MSNILVTGGAGFIGTHLCKRLVDSGHTVSVLDLKKPSTAIPNVQYNIGDVRVTADLDKAIQGKDAVYHFAALVSVPLCQEQPSESYRTNLLATVEVLESIRRERSRSGKQIRFLFAGSSVVYGNLTRFGESKKEDSELAWPPSYYGAQKLGSEHAISEYVRVHQIPSVVYRFFNVFGPGQDPKSPYSGVISIFSNSLKENLPLRLNGGGAPTRDFISVHDVAEACALGLKVSESICDGKAINLGTGKSVSIRELAELMRKVWKKPSSTQDAPFRDGDVMHSQADISRAMSVLGWKPEWTLEKGLEELLHG